MHRPILKHLFPTLALLAAVVSASAALVDTDGNPATNDTYLGDIDMAVGTVGDLSTFISTGAVEQAVSEANAYTDTKTATKQDKLPYPTNAIPYAAISGTPTNVSAFNNDAGYVTKSVTNGLLSTATAAATYATKISVSSAAAASTNYTDSATTITEGMGEWVLSDSSVTYNGSAYPIYLYRFNPAPQYDYWALGQSVGSGSPFAYVPYNESATSLTFTFASSFTPSVITATRSKYYVLGSQTDKPIQPAGDYATDNDIAAVRSAIAAKLDATNGVAVGLIQYTMTPTNGIGKAVRWTAATSNDVSSLEYGQYNSNNKVFTVWSRYNLRSGKFGDLISSDDISGMATLFNLADRYVPYGEYKAGQLVVHPNGDALYICTSDYDGSAWNPAVFQEATVEDALAFIRGDLGNVWTRVEEAQAAAAEAMLEAQKKIDSTNGSADGLNIYIGTAWGLTFLGGNPGDVNRPAIVLSPDGNSIQSGTYSDNTQRFTADHTYTLPSSGGSMTTIENIMSGAVLTTNVIHRISANNMSLLWTGPYTGQTGLDILTFVSNNIPHEVTSYYLTWSDSNISASLTCTDGNYSFSAVPDDLSLYSVATTNQLSAATAEIGERIEEVEGMINTPHKYVLSQAPSYYYSGSASIPAGYYYRAVTGNGYFRYAARTPVPKGNLVLTGSPSDPIISKFGSNFTVDPNGMTISSVSSYESDGLYNIADMVYTPDSSLGLTGTFHCNILNPASELTAISFSPASGVLSFTTDDGVQHTCSITSISSTSCTYSDSYYNPASGTWNTASYSLTVSFVPTAATDWGFGVFNGSPLITTENIDTARSRLIERTGLPSQLGTGWGYKVYDFTSDNRYWQLNVPKLTVTMPSRPTYYNTPRQWANAGTFANVGVSVPSDAMSEYFYRVTSQTDRYLPTSVYQVFSKHIVSTEEKYSSDGCKTVNYKIGFFPRNPAADTFDTFDDFCLVVNATNITIGSSSQPYLWGGVSFENYTARDNSGLYIDGAVSVWESDLEALTRTYSTYYGFSTYTWITGDSNQLTNDIASVRQVYTYSKFRPSVSISGNTATITVEYDETWSREGIYLATGEVFKVHPEMVTTTTGKTLTFVLRTNSSLDTVQEPSERVITDYNQHFIYDEGLGCTWELCVSNGVFFTRRASASDYRRKEYINP